MRLRTSSSVRERPSSRSRERTSCCWITPGRTNPQLRLVAEKNITEKICKIFHEIKIIINVIVLFYHHSCWMNKTTNQLHRHSNFSTHYGLLLQWLKMLKDPTQLIQKLWVLYTYTVQNSHYEKPQPTKHRTFHTAIKFCEELRQLCDIFLYAQG